MEERIGTRQLSTVWNLTMAKQRVARLVFTKHISVADDHTSKIPEAPVQHDYEVEPCKRKGGASGAFQTWLKQWLF